MLTYVFAVFMFGLEFYHILAHSMIMFGIRTLPRKDLVRVRYYFFVDGLTVFISSFLLTGWFRSLALLHLIQHAFYFITWNKSVLAKRIINWSSLDWFRNETTTQWDSAIGTAYDIVVHMSMMYAISFMLNATGMIIGIILAKVALYAIVFNPKFAWSGPNNMPGWVQKRLEKY